MLQGIDPHFGNSLGVSQQHISHLTPHLPTIIVVVVVFLWIENKEKYENGQIWVFNC
jgi:hypothetical protein